ncbi:MAG TPA: hypothetical protein DIC51_01155 [Coxiellaceae bacterium]|nr:hypothetical protein [Coxiellaceae bacterium]
MNFMASMRQYTGKQLLTFIRNGRYAHAGEEEAITMMMDQFKKSPDQMILDVGCGLGGTAHFIQQNGWGQVTGLDIENNSIQDAKKHYPHMNFLTADVHQISEIFKNTFDIICLFNAFYSFREQNKALSALAITAKPQANLAIFDYLDLCESYKNPLFCDGKDAMPFIPIRLDTIESMLFNAGWKLLDTLVINEQYKIWYTNLVMKLTSKKEEAIKQFGQAIYDQASDTYHKLLNAIIKKELGGVIIYATKL